MAEGGEGRGPALPTIALYRLARRTNRRRGPESNSTFPSTPIRDPGGTLGAGSRSSGLPFADRADKQPDAGGCMCTTGGTAGPGLGKFSAAVGRDGPGAAAFRHGTRLRRPPPRAREKEVLPILPDSGDGLTCPPGIDFHASGVGRPRPGAAMSVVRGAYVCVQEGVYAGTDCRDVVEEVGFRRRGAGFARAWPGAGCA